MRYTQYDIVLITQKEYLNPVNKTPYIKNVLLEDRLLSRALIAKGYRVTRTYWDNPDFDWNSVRFGLFRATWDYFHRFDEFNSWLCMHQNTTRFINPFSIIKWNMNKGYLGQLRDRGINIPPTLYIQKGENKSLQTLVQESGWNQVILKPVIGGGARHTYLINAFDIQQYECIFDSLIQKESLIIQEFQTNILKSGEVSYIVFGGKYSHSVLKIAKKGDFRVQDDYGGSVHPHTASSEEKCFVEKVISLCDKVPVYARVDVLIDNKNELCLSELELIEPELWLRKDIYAPGAMADAVHEYISQYEEMEHQSIQTSKTEARRPLILV